MNSLDGDWGKEALRRIFLEVLESVRVSTRIKRIEPTLKELRRRGRALAKINRDVKLIALGKSAYAMAREFLDWTGLENVEGVVSTPYPAESDLRQLEMFNGGHPYPNAESFTAAIRIGKILGGLDHSDLVVLLVSGGGSAAVERPIDPKITLDEMVKFNELLVVSGANIVEMNTVRKHISSVKGGRLALAAYPAVQSTIYSSDVPPGYESFVASGPTMPDDSSVRL